MNIDNWKGTWVLQAWIGGLLHFWAEASPTQTLAAARHFDTKLEALEVGSKLPASEKWEVSIGHAA